MDPNNTPALEPPQGVHSNLQEPSSILRGRIAACSVCLTLATATIVARLYTRKFVLKNFNVEDYALLITFVGFTSWTAIIILAATLGDGKHQWNVSVANFTRLLFFVNIVEILYPPTMFPVKYAVLRQIESIFFNYRRRNFVYKMIRGLIWANFLFYLASGFAFLLNCLPREKIWHPSVEGRCIDHQSLLVATGIINVISDFTIMTIPLAVISQLQMPLKSKIGTGVVFSIGILATITSILRLYYTVELLHTEDVTFNIAPVGHWALGEFTAVILVACLPYLPRFLRHLKGEDKRSYMLSGSKPKDSRYRTAGARPYNSADISSFTELRAGPSRDVSVEDAVALHPLSTQEVAMPGDTNKGVAL